MFLKILKINIKTTKNENQKENYILDVLRIIGNIVSKNETIDFYNVVELRNSN